jgi:hypothetical protein
MSEERPLDGAAGARESGFLVSTCKGSLPICAAGVEGGRVDAGGCVRDVEDAPNVVLGRWCRPCNSFSASIANWNNLLTVLNSL